MLKICTTAVCAAALLCGTSPAAAEPATADPMFLVAANGPHAATLTAFTIAGADLSMTATGRFASADTERASNALEEAMEMAKVLPGYPQPAYVTFGLKLAF